MLIDTDVLIWCARGHKGAAKLVDELPSLHVAAISQMELMQGARDNAELRGLNAWLVEMNFQTLPLTENIGHRAIVYMEQYALSHGLHTLDALLAATAAENGLTLVSGNFRHYQKILDLDFHRFKP